MKKKDENENPPVSKAKNEEKANPPGNPVYPASEDIYSKGEREDDIDDEETPKMKKTSGKNKVEKWNEKDFDEDKSGSDLDVPGSELDDRDEKAGSEDEENDYYSLGGDDHDDLEEDRGD